MTRHDCGCVLTTVAVLALGTGPVGAADFLRGDANLDGELSISDARAVWLSWGKRTTHVCWEAFNADGGDGGTLGEFHEDSDFILAYLFSGGPPPPPPFPEVGPFDPIVGDSRRVCEEYGGGSALEDPEARLVILSAESAGGDDGQATVILGASHSRRIAGHSFSLVLPEEVFAGTQRSGVDLTGRFDNRTSYFDNGRLHGETFTHGFFVFFVRDHVPPSAEVVPIYEFVVCLREGTPAGEYPMVLSAGEFVDSATGRAIKPALVSGTLTVASDVRMSGDCPLPPPPPVDFLRGDVNSDGEVTISDAYMLRAHRLDRLYCPDTCFKNEPYRNCSDAWDVNGDGEPFWTYEGTDAPDLLNYLFSGGPPPAAPFPAVGPADPPIFGCEEYGGGSALEDPAARLEILSAESAGGDDGQATVILGASNSTEIVGHSFSMVLPQAVFVGAQKVGVDLTGTPVPSFDDGTMDGETFNHGFYLFRHRIFPSPEVVQIYELVVCLREGTLAGEYPLVLSAGEFVDAESGRAIKPALVSGTLTVASDVTVTGDCPPPAPSPPPPPPPPPPPQRAKNVTYQIDDAAATPGDSIVLPFTLHCDGRVTGYSFSVDFDEELLTATEIEEVWKIPGGFGFSVYEINNDNNTPGNTGVDEGFLEGAALFRLDGSVSLPANEDVVALRFHFDIHPDAPDSTTQVRFLDRPGGAANVITADGVQVGPELLESFVFVDCTLRIQKIIDITTFRRGDSNGDGDVNLSDAQHTLNYLFSASPPPACYDAADSNDDGQLNIADPINTLRFLFVESGAATLPPPNPDEGKDPTADGMTCGVIRQLEPDQ